MNASTCCRTLAAAGIVALVLGGCTSAYDTLDSVKDTVSDFSPFGGTKKPLPGERRPVFPEGVPGVEQGVPAHLMPGAQASADALAATPVEPAPAAKVEEPKKPRVKRRVQTAAPARKPPTRQEPAEDAVWPEPPKPSAAPAQAARPAPAPASSAAPAGWAPPPQQPAPAAAWPDPPKPR